MAVSTGSSTICTLRDGGRILVRPVVSADREQLARGYAALSPSSRHGRFGAAPDRLSADWLDRLVDLDDGDRYAVGALAVDEPGRPGLGVARYARHRDDPTVAEVAVVVVDTQQGRGIGRALLDHLVAVARANGIATLTGTVLWENTRLLDAARSVGATVTPAEPGVATVVLQLDRARPSAVRRTRIGRDRGRSGADGPPRDGL